MSGSGDPREAARHRAGAGVGAAGAGRALPKRAGRQRGWIEHTVLRAEPYLFGLYSVVVRWHAALPERDRHQRQPTWTGKTMVTFSDAITLVRRDLWRRWIFEPPRIQAGHAKTHAQLETLTYQHAHAGNLMAKVELSVERRKFRRHQ